MDIDLCPTCGNNHSGSCTTDLIYFVWYPPQNSYVTDVELVGDWHKWQIKQKLSKEYNDKGESFFQLALTLPVGTYEYKYLVNGNWTIDQTAPVKINEFGTLNNYIEVHPKKTFIELLEKKNDIKITSNISIEGLKIVGSWDNWKQEIPMTKSNNKLKGCEENVVYLRLLPNTSYEFKFKLGKQYLIDEKYPTVINKYGTQNNRIITYSDRIETPTGWKARQSFPVQKNITCRSFEWEKITPDSELSYEKVEGHSLCTIGDHIFIFGGTQILTSGKTRGQFVNSLVKINVHQFSKANGEEVLPPGRAFHSSATYGSKMLIFGGISNTILQDYYTFDTAEGAWLTPPTITGKFPPKKEKQSCVLYDMMLVFFGGYNGTSDFQYEIYYNEITALNIQHMRWINDIKTQGKLPKGRFSHSASLIKSEMYVFGGITNSICNDQKVPIKGLHVSDQKDLNDMWKINLEEVDKLVWTELTPKGKLPEARHGHSMSVISHFLIIFGGRTDKQQFLNDVCVFDTEKVEWIYPVISGEVPRPRFNHAVTVIHNDYLVVFGGRTKDQNQKINKYFYLLRPKQFQSNLDIEEQQEETIA